VTLRELLGEEVSVASDLATVHVGAALSAAARAGRARSGSRARVQWERAALQFRKAGRAIAEAELAALERARRDGGRP
jgi:hypothetical protein